MCGILGYLSFDGSPAEVDSLTRLTNLLRHRGPDGGGYWAEGPAFLGHRRLSIIDVAGGHQPMVSADGRLLITFNGEIYNYIELRDELCARGHEFRTSSDTEVLLAGYREWGRGLAARLTGMFAFGIFDREEGEMYLARDRIGEKPLLYRETHKTLMFSSEMAPIARAMGSERDLDREALAGYLCLNYVPGERTMMRGVRRLSPGSWRVYGRAGLRASGEYWSAKRSATATDPPSVAAGATGDPALNTLDQNADLLQQRLDDAIAITLRSDVPVGLFLSGGMDSSLVAESAARQGRLQRAFCLDMEGSFSEWSGAEHVARQVGVELERVNFGPRILERFLDVVEHADDPLADSSALPVWAISEAACRHVKVALGGDGGDELFAGYLTYPATLFHSRFTSALPATLRGAIAAVGRRLRSDDRRKVSMSYKLHRFLRAVDLPPAQAHFSWNGTWLPDEASGLLCDADAKHHAEDALVRMAQRHELARNPDLDSLQRADLRDYLVNDILVKVDRMSMAHGLELRAPLLNPGIIDLALALPEKHRRTRTSGGKRLLRHLCHRHFGETISRGKKQGFSIPIHEWLRGPARDLLIDTLSPEAVRSVGVFDPRAIERVRDDHLNGSRALGWELWGLMVLCAWHRLRITGCEVRRDTTAADELGRVLVD